MRYLSKGKPFISWEWNLAIRLLVVMFVTAEILRKVVALHMVVFILSTITIHNIVLLCIETHKSSFVGGYEDV